MGKRLYTHFLSIVGGQLVVLAGNVLLIPIFLAHWSATTYGEWMVLSSVTNYFSTLDFGMNSAVGNRLLAAYTQGDIEDYKRCKNSAMAFYLALACGATLLTGVAVWLLPITSWTGLRFTSEHDAAIITFLLSLQVLWMMPTGLLGNTYRTVAEPAKTQWINNSKYFATLCITALILALHGTMKMLAFCQFLPVVVMALFVIWDLRRHYRIYMPGVTQAHFSIISELLKPSLFFAIIMIALAIGQQGSVLIISSALGGAAVAIFVTSRTLGNVIMQTVRTMSNTVWPDVTMLYAKGDMVRLRTMYRLLVFISTSLCIGVAASLWFEGPRVIQIWSHHRLTPDLTFLRLLLLSLVLQSPWFASSTFMIAINKHKNLSISYITANILGVIGSALLVHRLGIIAVPMSFIAGEAIACYHFVIKDACKIVCEPYKGFAIRLWLGIMIIGLISLAFSWEAHNNVHLPLIMQCVFAGFCTLLPTLFLTWWTWFSPTERLAINTRIKSYLPYRGGRLAAKQSA